MSRGTTSTVPRLAWSRMKYDSTRTLEDFSAKLRSETDLSDDILSVVQDTMQPEYTSLWLKPADHGDDRSKSVEETRK